jgi:hypothetical protein
MTTLAMATVAQVGDIATAIAATESPANAATSRPRL